MLICFASTYTGLPPAREQRQMRRTAKPRHNHCAKISDGIAVSKCVDSTSDAVLQINRMRRKKMIYSTYTSLQNSDAKAKRL